MRSRSWTRVTSSVCLLLALGGCSGPDLSAVPTEATAPFVCDGVPEAGTALLLGGKVAQKQTHGRWGDDGAGFDCVIELESGGAGRVMVIAGEVGVVFGATDEASSVEEFSKQGNATAIDADATGGGYVYGSGANLTAAWACGGRVVSVEIFDADVKSRDGRADAGNLLVSMLPWACGGQDPPKQTVEQ